MFELTINGKNYRVENIAAVFTGGECSASESVVFVSRNGTKATNWAC
jgi:hypothetical protein